MSLNIFDVEQEFASNNGYKTEVIWDLLSANQGFILKKKIQALIPDQETGKSKVEEMRETLFQKVWAQRKYTNKNSLSSIFYVLVTSSIESKVKALRSTTFSCHPVFRTRRCIDVNDSSKCCMIYIDEVGRVYQNWKSYIENNVLPKGLMVTPRNGVYTFDEDNMVNLEIHPTPASTLTQAVLEVADTSTMMAGLASAGISIFGAFTAVVAAPVVAGAATVGLGCAIYSTMRSGSSLIDRSKHDQSIALSDRQARGSWLGVATGVVGVGASSSTRLLQTAATAGNNVSKISVLAVNSLNVTSIVLSGSGIANGVLDMILKRKDGEEITSLELLQLAASLIIFTHSVNNFRLASNLVQEAQANKIQSIREGLSNRQRKMFDKMSKETIRIKGVQQGKMDVIRSMNEIPSNKVFNDLHKINRQLNGKNVRPSFGGSGKPIVLNNEVKVDTQTLRNSVQHNVGPDVLSGVTQPIPATYEQPLSNSRTNVPRIVFAKNKGNPLDELRSAKLVFAYGNLTIPLANLGNLVLKNIQSPEKFKDVVLKLAEEFSENIIHFIFHLLRKFITNVEYVNKNLKKYISSESVLHKIIQKVLMDYKNWAVDNIRKKEKELLDYLRKFFEDCRSKNLKQISSETNDESPQILFPETFDENDSILEKLSGEKLRECRISMPSGTVVNLTDFGYTMFNHVDNAENFLGLIIEIAEAYSEESFIFIMSILQRFIETKLLNIHSLLKVPISTEEVFYRLQLIVNEYDNNSCEFLRTQSTNILSTLEKYFLSLNPNVDKGKLKRCEECSGYYSICEL